MAGSREPLGSGIVTLIVVDAVLLLIFLVMLLQFLRADDAGAPPATDGTPTSTATSTGGAGGQTVAFTLPSRNITCTIGEDATRCAIAEYTYAPPSVEGCSGRTGHEIELTADGARWLCTTGAAPGTAGNDVDVLDYGSSTAANGFTCESSEEGVDCRHEESGHSFSLARAGATLD